MPQKTNLNVDPYYDNFDQEKNFYKMLFRPGYSIQARELTQLQTILQNQIEQFGKYAFKQGELVIPGEVGFNTKLNFAKLSSVSEIPVNQDGQVVYKKYDIRELRGERLRGLTSGVVGSVVDADIASETESDVVFVNYTNSGNSGNENTFRQGETLEVVDGVNTPLLVVGTDGSVLPTSIQVTNPDTSEVTSLESPAMGYASAVQVEEGIYFVNGYFVRNSEQLLVVDKYYDKPSAKIGFKISESIVTPEEDESLYDNAIGSNNYTAPGAHRLKISLDLIKYELSQTTDKNFIQLLSVRRGSVQSQIVKTDYNLLEQTLARRTFDESGDYVVDNFSLDIREYYQKNGNFGVYSKDDLGLVNGISETEAEDKLVASVGSGKAYVKGFEIVNKETKYVEINKARETLNREDIRLKTQGLPTYKITNTFGSIPLNSEGSELTAYPNIFICSTFNDGSIGLNNTENANDFKQTLSRRGLSLDENSGVKTIYINVDPAYANTFSTLNDTNFVSSIGTLWFVQTRTDAGEPSVANQVTSIAYSKVNRVEVNPSSGVTYLELTITATKNLLDQYFLEYDSGSPSGYREIFLSENDAKNPNATPFGTIVDYNETITPVIGTIKPSNFTFIESGSGFNSDTDVVLSKGRQEDGTFVYNSTFGLSYFDPQFFTKILLDERITVSGSFTPGQYVYGIESGAYGVVEGSSTGSFTTTKTLMIKSLFGNFKPGEAIRDEKNNTLRIARDNTISHFVVTNRGSNYVESSKLRIDGVEFDSSKVKLNISGGGAIISATVENRELVDTIYSKPPLVEVIQGQGGGTPNAAVVTPILVRNAVTTYTPQNAKSFFCRYGSGNTNVFTSDIEVNKERFAEVVSVTDFTFSGERGRKYIECNGFGGDATKFLQ